MQLLHLLITTPVLHDFYRHPCGSGGFFRSLMQFAQVKSPLDLITGFNCAYLYSSYDLSCAGACTFWSVTIFPWNEEINSKKKSHEEAPKIKGKLSVVLKLLIEGALYYLLILHILSST